jgi:Domain of unknown function (DUF4411)
VMYLLDANVLITAATSFYKIKRVPEYWDWLTHHGARGRVKIPQEIYEEIASGTDELSKWIKNKPCKNALLLKESSDPATVRYILDNSHGENLTEIEMATIGRDPFLIAYAFKKPNRCVVTSEVSQSGKKRRNTKIPDACDKIGVNLMSTSRFLDALDFRTNWKP